MRKIVLLTLLLLTLILSTACKAEDTTLPDTTPGSPDTSVPDQTTPAEEDPMKPTYEDIKALRETVWEEYVASLPASRATELVKNKISYVTVGNRKMKVNTRVFGKKPEGGYPIFIVLHGGGSDPTGEMNESQWSGMHLRYANMASCPGIFVSCRAIEDTWNCHSVDNAYAFYDRIIENASIYLEGDPNRAYIVGYSAGGDGVYQIAPRMADRFAAANMSAGHPNGVSMVNTYNLPFFLQVGELDTAYNRNTVTVEYSNLLDSLAEKYGGGFPHEVFVHTGKEHGVVGDNATTNQSVVKDTAAWLAAGGRSGVGGSESVVTHAGLLMSAYTRNPLPERILWDLSCRTPAVRRVTSFYWVSAPATVKDGILDITYDKDSNTIRVNTCTVKAPSNARFTVYLSEDMLDLFSEVTFDFCGVTTVFTPTLSEDTLKKTTAERGDANFQFISSFTFDLTGKVTG